MTIRRLPTDFVVEELLRGEAVRSFGAPSRARRFAVYELTKTGVTTVAACARLARRLGVAGGRVSYAGLKDKHASTRQHVTVGRIDAGAAPAEIADDGWGARLVGWSAEEASAAWIRRNRFTITVRGLTEERCAAMDEAVDVLALPGGAGGGEGSGERRLLVVNYFGDQRFGSARHGVGFVGRRLIEGDFEGALRLAIGTPSRKDTGARRALSRALAEEWGRWDRALERVPRCPERRAVEVLARGGEFREAFAALPYFFQQMCVEAYQSHLWNAMARRVAREIAGEDAIVAADRQGELVFPRASRVSVPMRSVELPMPAPGTRAVKPWRRAAEQVMAEEGIGFGSLAIPGLRRPAFGEAWRALFVLAERFVMEQAEADELAAGLKRVVRFELPRGAYATVVLRALGE